MWDEADLPHASTTLRHHGVDRPVLTLLPFAAGFAAEPPAPDSEGDGMSHAGIREDEAASCSTPIWRPEAQHERRRTKEPRPRYGGGAGTVGRGPGTTPTP